MTMCMCTRWISTALFGAAAWLASVTPALAQTQAETLRSTPSFEFGATSGVLAIFPTFGARATVALSPRFALEGVGEYVPWVLDDAGGHHFILQGQLRHTFRRGENWTWHATYGGSFFATYNHTDEARVHNRDGSVLVFPEQHSLRVEAGAVHVGIGAGHPISRRVAIRWDAQAIQSLIGLNYPIPRGTIGITWK